MVDVEFAQVLEHFSKLSVVIVLCSFIIHEFDVIDRCPRCKAPIRTALRYGNVIKNTLADFEKVKAKLIIPDYKLQMESQRLHDELSFEGELHPNLKDDADKIIKSVSMKGLTAEQLNMYENQINFLCFLNKVISGIESGISKLRKETRIFLSSHEGRSLLRRFMKSSTGFDKLAHENEALAEPIRKRIMMLRGRFSNQEKEEINDELLRLSVVVSYNTFVNLKEERPDRMADVTLGRISDAIESKQKMSKYCKNYNFITLISSLCKN